MDKRSPGGRVEERRKHCLSGQPLCRMAMGVASRGVPVVSRHAGGLLLSLISTAGERPALLVKATASPPLVSKIGRVQQAVLTKVVRQVQGVPPYSSPSLPRFTATFPNFAVHSCFNIAHLLPSKVWSILRHPWQT